MHNLFLLIVGYLLGAIPTGYITGKWIAKIDLREFGSGSTGATNVLRYVGKGPALVVFLIDVLKGVIAVLLAKTLNAGELVEVIAGLSALAGHIWPIWLNWKGGKAVATGLGVLLGISWEVGAACLGIFLIALTISKIVSLSSISAALSLPVLMAISFPKDDFRSAHFCLALGSMAIVLWRHRSNISRLIKGNEPRIGQSS